MKAAISIPDDLFKNADRLAGRMGTSRSRLYTRAIAEFVARHDADHITQAMNAVIDQVGGNDNEFVKQAARRTLQGTEW